MKLRDVEAVPPVSVGGLTLFGMSLPDVVLIATLVYTVIMVVEHLPKAIDNVYRLWRKYVRKEGDRCTPV